MACVPQLRRLDSGKTDPALIREYPTQQLPTPVQMCSLRHNRSRNGVITTDTDPKHETPAEDPRHFEVCGRNGIRQSDAHDDSNHTNNKFIAVDEPPTIYVSEIAERELPKDVAEIGGSVNEATEEGRVVGSSTL